MYFYIPRGFPAVALRASTLNPLRAYYYQGWCSGVAFGEETFKRALKAKLVEALREELTSGDGSVRALLAQLVRWGRDVMPSWVHGGEVVAPGADTALVSWIVPSGRRGYIYGFYVSADEGNVFKIVWVSDGVAYSRRVIMPGRGTLHFVDVVALNEGLAADPGSMISLVNVNAGSEGAVYQAALLVATV
jgi:hypothetical protein